MKSDKGKTQHVSETSESEDEWVFTPFEVEEIDRPFLPWRKRKPVDKRPWTRRRASGTERAS